MTTTERTEEQKYWDDVREMAKDIQDHAKDEGYPDREEILEYIHESIDGCARVIYTWQAKMCIVYSSNDGAYADNYGAEGMVDKDGNINWSAMAYAAFEADVMEQLDADGFDVNADNPGKPEDDAENDG